MAIGTFVAKERTGCRSPSPPGLGDADALARGLGWEGVRCFGPSRGLRRLLPEVFVLMGWVLVPSLVPPESDMCYMNDKVF